MYVSDIIENRNHLEVALNKGVSAVTYRKVQQANGHFRDVVINTFTNALDAYKVAQRNPNIYVRQISKDMKVFGRGW